MAKIGKLFIDFEAGTANFDGPISKSRKKLGLFGKTAVGVQKATRGLGGGLTRMIAPLAGIAAGFAGVNAVFSNLRTFEQLNARLKTATGSTLAAKDAMDTLKGVAQEMPFELTELADSFIKLENFGLNASEEALKSYGNTAAALGQDLDTLIEAVADAAVGEFERLKTFGILTRNQGDTIKFTFRGVTTQIQNDSQAIQQFLINMGNTEFAGGMADQMNTIDGRLSLLRDSFFKLSTAVMDTDEIKSATEFVTNAFNRISESLDFREIVQGIKRAGSFEFVDLSNLAEAEIALGRMVERGDTSGFAQNLKDRIELLREEKKLNEDVKKEADRTAHEAQSRVALEIAADDIRKSRLPIEQKLLALKEKEKKLTEDLAFGLLPNIDAGVTQLKATAAEIDNLENQLERAKKASEKFTNSLSEGLARGVVRGGNLLDILRSVVEQLAVDDLTNFFKSAFRGEGGGSSIGGLFGAVKTLFTPRANGGPVTAGAGYLVGERGPELFTPSVGGMITPNNALAGGASMTVNNYFDIRGSDDMIQRQIAASVDMAVSMSVGKMQDLKRRGAIA